MYKCKVSYSVLTEYGIAIGIVCHDFDELSDEEVSKILKGSKIIKPIDKLLSITVMDVEFSRSMWGGRNITVLLKGPILVQDFHSNDDLVIEPQC